MVVRFQRNSREAEEKTDVGGRSNLQEPKVSGGRSPGSGAVH